LYCQNYDIGWEMLDWREQWKCRGRAFRHMTGRDLDAIYAYLSAIPSAQTPEIHCKNAGQ